MQERTADSYLQKLSELMLSTQVTGKEGDFYSLEEGSDIAVRMVLERIPSSGKIMLVGNGGSAAVVSHVQNDLCKAVGVRGLVFTEQPLLTAFANDEGYGSVFEAPINLWAEARDLLITVSSSGNSENIVRSVEAAVAKGCDVITFSGFAPDNRSRSMGNLNFYVGSDVYGYVETAHAALTHYITDRARSIVLDGEDPGRSP